MPTLKNAPCSRIWRVPERYICLYIWQKKTQNHHFRVKYLGKLHFTAKIVEEISSSLLNFHKCSMCVQGLVVLVADTVC